MTKRLTDLLAILFKRRQLVRARVPSGFLVAILAVAVMAVSPMESVAQRSSTSSGNTKRTERTSTRSKDKAVSTKGKRTSKARSTGSRSRKSAARAAGRVIQDARSNRKSSNERARGDRSRGEQPRSADQRTRSDRSRSGSEGVRGTTRTSSDRGVRSNGSRSEGVRSGSDRNRGNRDTRSVVSKDRSRDQRATNGRDRRAGSSARTGERVLDRSSNGRVAAARGASRTSRDRNIVIDGRRARLSLPGVQANWRSYGDRHVRFRTRLHVRPTRYYHRPHTHISVHIAWPWKVRYQRHWSPRYRYRQVVIVKSDWNRSYRTSRIEMETTYRHRVRFATDEYAVLDIDIEQVALYDNGRYIGMVDRIPAHLSSIEATVFRNGDIAFDRDIFLVGDRRSGFEIISTPFYDGYAGQGYRYGDDVRVGQVDLRRHRVRSKGYSRLFDPNRWRGHAPISLLPEDEGWLWDFGADAISAACDDYDAYYGFGAGHSGGWSSRDAFETQSTYGYDTAFGAHFNVERSATIRRVE